MKIGILSDTHGNLERTKYAVSSLLDKKVQHVIHCGDIGSEEVLIEITRLLHNTGIKMDAVLGNVDVYNNAVEHFPESSGITVKRFHRLTLDGKYIAVFHGDDFQALQNAIEENEFDYIFTGHTHEADDRHIGDVRVINPGAVHHTAKPGFATLDLESGELTYFPIH